MRVVETSLRRPVTVFIFAVAAVVFGWVAFRSLAVDLLPDISYPSLTVRAIYEGAAPAEVESLVTRPIENGVGVVNNVVRVTSSSRPDVSEVVLEFAWGTNMDFASLDVRERLDRVRLPVPVQQPVLLRFDPSLDPVLRLGLTGVDDLVRLRLLGEEEVKRILERVDGVAAAVVSGGLEEEIQVELNEGRVTALGLDVDTVRQRLAADNVNLTGGRLREGQTEYLVRTVNEFLRPEDLREVVVHRSGSAIVRLADIATVRKGSKDRDVISRIDGREAVEVAVYKEGGTNTVRVVDAVERELDELRERLVRIDPSLRADVITDQARYIRQSVNDVVGSAIQGGALAILVLFLFLRSLKNTLIIGISIPVSVMATFFLMYASGISLNIMSLGGLTLGIGMLVDNSIVVLESIQRKREEGMAPLEAARVGAGEVARAVTASTITTVCVFAPIVFVEGIAGQLFGDQALTVTFSLLVSLVMALTVVPMLASRQAATAPPEASPTATRSKVGTVARRSVFAIAVAVASSVAASLRLVSRIAGALVQPVLAGFERALGALAGVYDRVLAGVLRRPALVVAGVFLLLLASLGLLRTLGMELVPELIQGEFYVDAELQPGTRLEITDRRLQRIALAAAALPGVDRVYVVAGASSEQGGASGELRENIGQITVRVADPSTREGEEELMALLRQEIDAQNRVYAQVAPARDTVAPPDDSRASGALRFRFGRPSYFSFRTPIEVELRGYNLTLLERLAAELVTRLREIPGLADVKSSTEGGTPELQIVFDRQRLAALGYGIAEIGALVRAKVQGEIASEIQRDDRSVGIRMRSEESFRDSVRDLRDLNVARTQRSPIPLSSVAQVIETEGPAEIRRADGSRVALVEANLVGRDLAGVSRDIESVLLGMTLPPGFEWSVGGQRQEMETSFRSMRLAILLAVFMVYLVMASQFESLLHPFVILFSVPFAAVGVTLVLWATGTTISIVVLIGVILLAGIVVNNAIILIDYTNQLRAAGAAKLDALRQAGRIRLRPILMTTATTVLGLLPMALGLGEGSELRAPMAITVVGGLLSSTLLTLLLIPAVYALLDHRA
ncbi:MAG TPA: efflux RND transporter permease subunit [Thermoanaerobaculia bacterium]|nr:efflux RND transporter permease subunit [Thermoanaerobaculia bacterium]